MTCDQRNLSETHFQKCSSCLQEELRYSPEHEEDISDPSLEDQYARKLFHKFWPSATDDNPLTLFGFRRFRTAHLVNLRFLEEEIDSLSGQIYRAGESLKIPLSPKNKLGLGRSKNTSDASDDLGLVTKELVTKLRQSIKEYDEGLIAFNNIMMMETFALADSGWLGCFHNHLSKFETYKTRLLRVDLLARRGSKDLIEHSLRKCLRMFWFFVRLAGHREAETDLENASKPELEKLRNTYQRTSEIAEFATRFIVAIMAGSSLVIPLVVLTDQTSTRAHLATIIIFVVLFSLIVSLLSKASNQEIMAASAAYAAVLVVFISNNSINIS